jgi:hypothetical protein
MDGCHQRTYNWKRLNEKKEQLKYRRINLMLSWRMVIAIKWSHSSEWIRDSKELALWISPFLFYSTLSNFQLQWCNSKKFIKWAFISSLKVENWVGKWFFYAKLLFLVQEIVPKLKEPWMVNSNKERSLKIKNLVSKPHWSCCDYWHFLNQSIMMEINSPEGITRFKRANLTSGIIINNSDVISHRDNESQFSYPYDNYVIVLIYVWRTTLFEYRRRNSSDIGK